LADKVALTSFKFLSASANSVSASSNASMASSCSSSSVANRRFQSGYLVLQVLQLFGIADFTAVKAGFAELHFDFDCFDCVFN
jgi:hypothetical protein